MAIKLCMYDGSALAQKLAPEMVITFSASGTANGPRPIDPNRDFPQLAQLLKTVFHEEMEDSGQQFFEGAAGSIKAPMLWRLDPFFSRLTPGFVWEEDGRIVGNVTMLPTRSPRRFIVANVAIYPDYRRRGIARALMEAAQIEALKRGGKEIRLQVNRDNEGAKALYRSLGYDELGTVTTWNLLSSRSRFPDFEIHPSGREIKITEMPASRWREAYQLDQLTPQADLEWPDPLSINEYHRSLRRRLADFVSGRQLEIWMTANSAGRMHGIATIKSEWGRVHQFRIRVHPDSQGELEESLVLKLMRRLQYLPRRQVRLLHDADDQVMNELLPTLRFRPTRMLSQMRLALE